MIFSSEQARLILEGRKTQTRRAARREMTVNERPVVLSLRMHERERLMFTRYRVGNVIPLERPASRAEMTPEEIARVEDGAKRPSIPVAQITINGLDLQRLGDIDVRAARAEGFKTTDEFKTGWVTSREPSLAMSDEATSTAVSRFDSTYANRLVWALSIAVVDAPRLLAADPSRAGDYTTDPRMAVRFEPEAIPADLQETYSRIARATDRSNGASDANETIRNLRSQLAELRGNDLTGIANHREIQREISRLERSLDALTRKLSGRLVL